MLSMFPMPFSGNKNTKESKIPDRYDFLLFKNLISDLEIAKNANINSHVVKRLEEDYIIKRFNDEPEFAHKLLLIARLDPLSNYTVDEKIKILESSCVTKINATISFNIISFIDRAESEHSDFYKLDFDSQKQIMKEYAEEVDKENDVVILEKEVLQDLPPLIVKRPIE